MRNRINQAGLIAMIVVLLSLVATPATATASTPLGEDHCDMTAAERAYVDKVKAAMSRYSSGLAAGDYDLDDLKDVVFDVPSTNSPVSDSVWDRALFCLQLAMDTQNAFWEAEVLRVAVSLCETAKLAGLVSDCSADWAAWRQADQLYRQRQTSFLATCT